jgi:HD-GYP domain-containing protein (c-di-GMP phosphodiesterase class II)
MESIVTAFESVMGTRDPYTVAHQRRVTQISVAIAEEMGLEPKRLINLEIAARIHDLGKISIPMSILSKTGKLSVSEMVEVKRHSIVGVNILRAFNYPVNVFLTIMQHHERINGTGYPFGLSGEDILLEARILAVADVVDAISFDRPYRSSPGIENALYELWQNKGILYDKSVVDAFDKLYSMDIFGNFFISKDFIESDRSPLMGFCIVPVYLTGEGGKARTAEYLGTLH